MKELMFTLLGAGVLGALYGLFKKFFGVTSTQLKRPPMTAKDIIKIQEVQQARAREVAEKEAVVSAESEQLRNTATKASTQNALIAEATKPWPK